MATRGNLFGRVKKALRSGLRRVARRPAREEPRHGLAIAYDVSLEPRQFNCALSQSLGVTLTPGHDVRLLDNGSVFDALISELGSASLSINLVIYIWEPGRLSERLVTALAGRARAGVHCRLLVDALGSPRFERDLAPRLVAAGCEVRMFRPQLGQAGLRRNHRRPGGHGGVDQPRPAVARPARGGRAPRARRHAGRAHGPWPRGRLLPRRGADRGRYPRRSKR